MIQALIYSPCCEYRAQYGYDVNTPEFLRKNLKELAVAHDIPEMLIDGMLDRDLVIVRARRADERGMKKLMTEQEFVLVKKDWVADGTIKGGAVAFDEAPEVGIGEDASERSAGTVDQ